MPWSGNETDGGRAQPPRACILRRVGVVVVTRHRSGAPPSSRQLQQRCVVGGSGVEPLSGEGECLRPGLLHGRLSSAASRLKEPGQEVDQHTSNRSTHLLAGRSKPSAAGLARSTGTLDAALCTLPSPTQCTFACSRGRGRRMPHRPTGASALLCPRPVVQLHKDASTPSATCSPVELLLSVLPPAPRPHSPPSPLP